MSQIFARSSTQYTPLVPKQDGDGKVWLKVVAHDTLVAKTTYKVIMNEYGWVTAALADDVLEFYVGVSNVAQASGDEFWIQIGGYCASMVTESMTVTAGHAIKMYDGVTTDAGADYSGADGEFAVNCVTTTVAATVHNVILVPKIILNTT